MAVAVAVANMNELWDILWPVEQKRPGTDQLNNCHIMTYYENKQICSLDISIDPP